MLESFSCPGEPRAAHLDLDDNNLGFPTASTATVASSALLAAGPGSRNTVSSSIAVVATDPDLPWGFGGGGGCGAHTMTDALDRSSDSQALYRRHTEPLSYTQDRALRSASMSVPQLDCLPGADDPAPAASTPEASASGEDDVDDELSSSTNPLKLAASAAAVGLPPPAGGEAGRVHGEKLGSGGGVGGASLSSVTRRQASVSGSLTKAYTIDLERTRDQATVGDRSFGGMYVNRRTRVQMLDGEKELLALNGHVVIPSLGRDVKVRFMISNFRLSLRLLDASQQRAISIPLSSIEKIRFRKHQGGDVTASSAALNGKDSAGAEGAGGGGHAGRDGAPQREPRSRSPSPAAFADEPPRTPEPTQPIDDIPQVGGTGGAAAGGAAAASSMSAMCPPPGVVPSRFSGAVAMDSVSSLSMVESAVSMITSPSASGRAGLIDATNAVMQIQTKGVASYTIIIKAEDSAKCQKLLHTLTFNKGPDELFCLVHKAAYKGKALADDDNEMSYTNHIVAQEFRRFIHSASEHVKTHWRLSRVNQNYKLAPSYPGVVIVPANAPDKTIEAVSQFRTKSRFPVAAWIHPETGAAMCRSSQPKVGFGGKRCNYDEVYVCMLRRPEDLHRECGSGNGGGGCGDGVGSGCGAAAAFATGGSGGGPPGCLSDDEAAEGAPGPANRAVVILDCRPFANAVANRSRAGGYEDERHYPGCTYENADIGNIHDITASLKALRRLVAAPPPPSSGAWAGAFHTTGWCKHLEKIITAAIRVVRFIESGNSVLIHCSDGWDRTSQVVSLAKLLIDPFFRTIEGFQILLRTDWLAAGHKFADRHFNAERETSMGRSEMSPIFLQWMDCVWQIWAKYPTLFEFTDQYLMYILYHSTSGRFSTFLHNSEKERREGSVGISLWTHINSPEQRYHRPEFLNVMVCVAITTTKKQKKKTKKNATYNPHTVQSSCDHNHLPHQLASCAAVLGGSARYD